MKPIFYSLILVIPACAALGMLWGGFWAWMTPLVVFGLIPLAETMLPSPRINDPEGEERARRDGWMYDAVVYAAVAAHLGLLVLYFVAMTTGTWRTHEVVGLTLSMGISCGGIGINLGHELGHRRDRFDQFLAKVAFSTSLYAHFFVEHNRGHHARVATADDPASARRGEWLYAFWVRSVVGGWLSAWRLEADRLQRRGESSLSWRNEVLRWQLAQALVLMALVATLGPVVVGRYVVAAVVGFLLLETVNYLEHYGLRRGRRPDGRLEPVLPTHSWNYNGVLGRLLLFELTRHSDHHAHPKRAYAALRHFDESPQLPAGYPGMILMALVPPLFFALMDPLLPAPVAEAPMVQAA